MSSVTKNLKVKAVAFEADVLIRANASNTGAAVQQAAPAVPTAPAAPAPLKAARPAVQDFDASGLKIDPKVKYADKLRLKVSKHNVDNPSHNPLRDSLRGSSSRWVIADGMGDLLDYLFNRSMRLAVLKDEATDAKRMDQLASQLRPTTLSFASMAPVSEDALIEMENELGFRKTDIFFVSSSDQSLALARKRGYFSCRYRPVDGLYGQVTTDFAAASALEIRDAINELTGIPLRSSVLLNS